MNYFCDERDEISRSKSRRYLLKCPVPSKSKSFLEECSEDESLLHLSSHLRNSKRVRQNFTIGNVSKGDLQQKKAPAPEQGKSLKEFNEKYREASIAEFQKYKRSLADLD